MAALTDGQTTISPAVLTSTAADIHINDTVKPAVADATAGMQNQAAKVVTDTQNNQQIQAGLDAAKNDAAKIQSEITANNAKANPAGTVTPPTGTPPAGMDTKTYAAFKAANPNIEPTAEDVQHGNQVDTIAQDQKALDQANADYQTQATQVQNTIKGIQNGSIPLNAGEQAQVTALQNQFTQLIQQQQLQNTGASGLANIRGYQTGSAEYDPSFQVKTIGAIVTAGIQKVTDLAVKEAGAVSQLTQALKDDDIAKVNEQWGIYKDASKNRTDALQKVIDDTQAAIKAAQDAQQKVVDSVNKVAEDAAKNGAPQDVITKITNAGSEAEAIGLAADYATDPTSTAGQYAAYVKSAQAKGLTPMTPGDFLAKQKANEAYSSAYASESGKAAADTALGIGDTTGGSTPDPTSTGITGATGLSLQAFNYLTQGTSSMSRMTAADRKAIMSEANAFLNKNGIDISTFQSQYKAYNDVLQHNLERANNTKIFAGEITGTVDQFVNDIGDNFGSLQAGNVAKLLAGEQVNDPTVQKYAFDLQTMQNDLAGYYAASRTGAANATPDDSDKRAAAEVILSGINGNSASAFKQSIVDNEQKVTKVVNNAATDAQKQVWDLFGVGSQFKPKEAQVDPKIAVNDYVSKNPTQTAVVASLYKLPGWTDQDVMDYITHLSTASTQ